MRIGSLFSGIGGLELGLERAGVGQVVWQVERDPFCRQVLARHWPEAVRYDDVCTVGATSLVPVDVLCGGFPCQDVSAAGKGEGLSGARSGLWYEMLRLVGELRPSWVVVENVASGAKRWLPFVRRDLWARGYAALPIRVRAADVGARHLRARIFVVAYPVGGVLRLESGRVGGAGRDETLLTRIDGEARSVADAHRARLGEWSRQRSDACEADGATAERNPEPWAGAGTSEPALVRTVHGVRRGMDRAAAGERKARVRALGNCVVPACAEVIGRLIVGAAGANP